MNLVRLAMRHPITVLVACLSVVMASVLALRRMPVDIFPELGSPAIYVAQPYGGIDPAQMEALISYYYEYHFLYIQGIEHVESKNIQNAALLKLQFYPGTDMSQALSETVSYVNRARAFMPPGAVGPFVLRYDAGNVPVAQLVFTSPDRGPGEMQDIALNRVRPVLATIPGVSAPPPFGGNARTIVVRLDPDGMRQYRLSPEDVVAAIQGATIVSPSGNVRIGDLTYIATNNGMLGENLEELLDSPVRVGGAGPAIYLRDIATIENSTDIIVGYAHVDGKRTVYIPVTKRAEFSTLSLIRDIRAALPRMRSVVPEDVDIRLEFDQSGFVLQSIRTLASEGILGAFFTALVIVLFLRHLRSALVVIITIPVALLSAIVCLWVTGQTINIMTLGGLALSVGVLVDQSIVAMESIHTHAATGLEEARAVLAAGDWTAGPLLMARLAILAVFLPAFFMTGVGGQLFVPLAMAVAFAMITSYFLANTLVPVLSTWLVRNVPQDQGVVMEKIQKIHRALLKKVIDWRWPVVVAYAVSATAFLVFFFPRLGTEIFPAVDSGQLQFRLRAPTGTRIERTELIALRALDIVREEVGPENVQISTGFIGIQGSSYPVNTIYLWTSGPQEAVLKVALPPNARLRGAALEERLRERFRQELADTDVSFEPADIVGQVMSMGSPTPIEVAVQGYDLAADRAHAEKIRVEMAKIPELRDLQYGQPLDYPTLHVEIDRVRAGQQGLTVSNVARSLVAATASTRFVAASFWKDDTTGVAYQIQAEIPPYRMNSSEEVRNVPIRDNGAQRPVLVGDVAEVKETSMLGEIDRYNMQRMVSLTANVSGKALGQITPEIHAAVARAGEPPRGSFVSVRGQIPPLEDTMEGLRNGLFISVVVIFLLLAGNFQSFRLAIAVAAIAPAVICGVLAILLYTGTTLNIQSFIGAIMALGIAAADSILLVAYAERYRSQGMTVVDAAWEGGCARLRALLMTVTGMTVGMIPLALGLGGGGEQAAPLGRAVIGGLIMATLTTMTFLPAVYAVLQKGVRPYSPSLDPDDPTSKYYEKPMD